MKRSLPFYCDEIGEFEWSLKIEDRVREVVGGGGALGSVGVILENSQDEAEI